MRKYALILAVGLVLGIGAACLVLVPRERSAVNRADRLESIEHDYNRVVESLGIQVGSAQDSSRKASELLEEYYRIVDERERARQKEFDRILGLAGEGGSGAKEIASGLDGDIDIARIIAGRLRQVQE